ncbi:hypothetical protein L6452_22227 [Arctium lappa]|uniref:Uncharacterized protein n=1 Tax=Arctium lappa TaxID=4217 RepID=A0ACB9B047_ARCLA|nr:hypothetical protein L6452_22227 [Arctium lappa]
MKAFIKVDPLSSKYNLEYGKNNDLLNCNKCIKSCTSFCECVLEAHLSLSLQEVCVDLSNPQGSRSHL